MPHILVVDDEVSIREPLRGFLESLGHEVTEATNGLEALTLLTQRDFDLVITDVMMPKMNGFQLLERALPHVGERIPMLVLTSMADESGVEAAIFAGAFDYLLKPCEPDRAEMILLEALKQREQWLARMSPYERQSPPIPAHVLETQKVPTEKAPKVVPPSGKSALRRSAGVVQVARPPDAGRSSEPAQEPRPTGLLGRLKGLFGKRSDAA